MDELTSHVLDRGLIGHAISGDMLITETKNSKLKS